VVAVIAALGFFLNAFRFRALVLPGLALALMLVASFTVGTLYPVLLQQFRVQPNEANMERPYIAHNIRFTRAAYGLGGIAPKAYHLGAPSGAVRQREAATLDNIRLWDYRVLAPSYRQLQGL